MSKEDVKELPTVVPHKRRALEGALDVHIAMWLASDTLTPSERKRLEGEKQRRKDSSPDRPVGLLVGEEGVTPEQLTTIRAVLAGAGPTEVHHIGVSGKLHGFAKALVDGHVTVHAGGFYEVDQLKSVVRESAAVIAGPKETSEPSGQKRGVWEAVKYAKHRRVPVTIVLPSGEIQNKE